MIIVLLICLHLVSSAQEKSKVRNNVLSGNFTYSFHYPRGDMQDRFGPSLELGIGVDYITHKRRIIFGWTGTLLFGNDVREDVLEVITNDNGDLVGTNQQVGIVSQKQRGFYTGLHIGKVFNFSQTSLSGIRFTFGAGLLSHKIRLQDDIGTVNLLKGDNIKGFDRLTNGLSFHQFLGYQHFGKSGLFNVFAGVEAYEGFTMSRRNFDNTLMRRDDLERMDILLGIKFGFMLKFNFTENPEEIYY